jgi:hypothetical protein
MDSLNKYIQPNDYVIFLGIALSAILVCKKNKDSKKCFRKNYLRLIALAIIIKLSLKEIKNVDNIPICLLYAIGFIAGYFVMNKKINENFIGVDASSASNYNETNQTSYNQNTVGSTNKNRTESDVKAVNETIAADSSSIENINESSFRKIDQSVTDVDMSQENINRSSVDMSTLVENIDSSVTELVNNIKLNMSIVRRIKIVDVIENSKGIKLNTNIETGSASAGSAVKQSGYQAREGGSSDTALKGDQESGDMGSAKSDLAKKDDIIKKDQQTNENKRKKGDVSGGGQESTSKNESEQASSADASTKTEMKNEAEQKSSGAMGFSVFSLLGIKR